MEAGIRTVRMAHTYEHNDRPHKRKNVHNIMSPYACVHSGLWIFYKSVLVDPITNQTSQVLKKKSALKCLELFFDGKPRLSHTIRNI